MCFLCFGCYHFALFDVVLFFWLLLFICFCILVALILQFCCCVGCFCCGYFLYALIALDWPFLLHWLFFVVVSNVLMCFLCFGCFEFALNVVVFAFVAVVLHVLDVLFVFGLF